jgi:hypothetical protein
MSKFVETLKLKELAEEDIFFARRDQELIAALHKRQLAEAVAAAGRKEVRLARRFEKRYRKVKRCCRKEPLTLLRALRRLIDRILAAFQRTAPSPD